MDDQPKGGERGVSPAVCLAIGVARESPGVGVALGMAFGAAFGAGQRRSR